MLSVVTSGPTINAQNKIATKSPGRIRLARLKIKENDRGSSIQLRVIRRPLIKKNVLIAHAPNEKPSRPASQCGCPANGNAWSTMTRSAAHRRMKLRLFFLSFSASSRLREVYVEKLLERNAFFDHSREIALSNYRALVIVCSAVLPSLQIGLIHL